MLNKLGYRYRKHYAGPTEQKYETGTYIDWRNSFESSDRFATSRRQNKRTQVQMVRESGVYLQSMLGIPGTNSNLLTNISLNILSATNPHFSPPFYCDDAMPHPACIWLGQSAKYRQGTTSHRLATSGGEKCGLKPRQAETGRSTERNQEAV
ncbi:MAG: hypothetical protein GY935_01905 [Gammaproteobacteria bacterium]|nr:hypothetical protein [Gammaproteobacteria bacterium]